MPNQLSITQDIWYVITEWDDSRVYVFVRSVGDATILRRRADGTPYQCVGGEVLMRYVDGCVHRVSAEYFASLEPEWAWTTPYVHFGVPGWN